MQPAIEMIADGSVKAEHFFHGHSFLIEIDPMTGEQISQTVSLLDDLIDFNKSSLPDLSSFAVGLFWRSKQPEEQLLIRGFRYHWFRAFCIAYREKLERVCDQVDGPLIENMLRVDRGIFPEKSKVPPCVTKSPGGTLDEFEGLPPSRARTASASKFACIVHVMSLPTWRKTRYLDLMQRLIGCFRPTGFFAAQRGTLVDINEQRPAFRRTVQIILSTPEADLICNVALSLKHLAPHIAASCADYLMNNARTHRGFHSLSKVIGEAVGKTGTQFTGIRCVLALTIHVGADSMMCL
ncbi:hypothetical protein GMOD_00010100 [Pyrenophora seminiperda CCB06]|uniref:Uncharacterized protein n=1 Tax=Pyrenophora seminiperda CCB06 TaxID=1302712 RepID=A0A3M7LZU0_9PLEO|nr:hypothetical protein GMOD_00010100 [Pyrenophora seminiperda CCB06]